MVMSVVVIVTSDSRGDIDGDSGGDDSGDDIGSGDEW